MDGEVTALANNNGYQSEGTIGMYVSRQEGMKAWNETHFDALLNVILCH